MGMTSTAVPAQLTPVSEDNRTEAYRADALTPRATLLGFVLAALAGGVVTLLGWFAFKTVSLPSFNTSMVTRALTTVGWCSRWPWPAGCACGGSMTTTRSPLPGRAGGPG